MKLKPMADNVLLKQHEAQETSIGGIILATTTKEKPAIYEVVAGGPGTKDVAMTVAAGDKVVYNISDTTDPDYCSLFDLVDCKLTMVGGKITENHADKIFYLDDSKADITGVTITGNASIVLDVDNSSAKVTLTDCVLFRKRDKTAASALNFCDVETADHYFCFCL